MDLSTPSLFFKDDADRADDATRRGAAAFTRLLELAETTAHEKSALWRTLQPLERKGWVAAETEPGARGQKLSVTPAGLEKLADALPLWRTAQSRVSDILGAL